MTNNDLQNIHCTHKAKDRVTWAPLKTVGELRWSGRVDSSCVQKSYHISIQICSWTIICLYPMHDVGKRWGQNRLIGGYVYCHNLKGWGGKDEKYWLATSNQQLINLSIMYAFKLSLMCKKSYLAYYSVLNPMD